MARRKKHTVSSPEATDGGAAVAEMPETKKEAVAQVLADKGRKTKPLEIVRLVKERFDLDLTPAHASNIKSTLRGKRGPKGRRKTGAEAMAAAAMSGGRRKSVVSVEDVQTVVELVGRVNPKELHYLIDVLTR